MILAYPVPKILNNIFRHKILSNMVYNKLQPKACNIRNQTRSYATFITEIYEFYENWMDSIGICGIIARFK